MIPADIAPTDRLAGAAAALPPVDDALRALVSLVLAPLRAVAFWTAALLPFAYLPLLATGTATARPAAFAALLAVNAVAFVVGHGHNRGASG
jgi:hypothetical protein